MDASGISGAFDAALPPLTAFGPGTVPRAGLDEIEAYGQKRADQRGEAGLYGGMSLAVGSLSWIVWGPAVPALTLLVFITTSAALGLAAARRFLQLAFGPKAPEALPPGTDIETARLEDGLHSLVREWNSMARAWNGRREKLRAAFVAWQDACGAAKMEHSDATAHRMHGERLLEALRHLLSERRVIMLRREEAERWLGLLNGRLLELRAAVAVPELAEGSDDLTET